MQVDLEGIAKDTRGYILNSMAVTNEHFKTALGSSNPSALRETLKFSINFYAFKHSNWYIKMCDLAWYPKPKKSPTCSMLLKCQMLPGMILVGWTMLRGSCKRLCNIWLSILRSLKSLGCPPSREYCFMDRPVVERPC
ncbi:unnamed protein product [Musa acuminata subsp. malaccensis]|uniref:(wild Malaysian banana) hypothetical protein n=1 Tax=Musa acuminata subsp. malaccensis TaxID=214687 RepID=A0A8D6ZYB3_MUSAM|nr:unnamed protein product [Musa acuminata subsp. malaccensis]